MRRIFPIIFIIIAIAIFFTVGKPLQSDVSVLSADVSQYNTALSNSTELEKTRDSLLDVYNKQVSPDNKDRLNKLLPNNTNNIELILEIQKIIDLYNLPLSNIKFDAPIISGSGNVSNTTNNASNTQTAKAQSLLPYGVFNLEFQTQGSYETFVSFVNSLEGNLRLINIKAITFAPIISKNGSLADTDNYKFDIKLETYWLKN